jgi:hypothetical protein
MNLRIYLLPLSIVALSLLSSTPLMATSKEKESKDGKALSKEKFDDEATIYEKVFQHKSQPLLRMVVDRRYSKQALLQQLPNYQFASAIEKQGKALNALLKQNDLALMLKKALYNYRRTHNNSQIKQYISTVFQRAKAKLMESVEQAEIDNALSALELLRTHWRDYFTQNELAEIDELLADSGADDDGDEGEDEDVSKDSKESKSEETTSKSCEKSGSDQDEDGLQELAMLCSNVVATSTSTTQNNTSHPD